MTTVHLELAKEDAAQQELLPDEMSPSVFIQVGIDLEEQQ